MAVPCQSISRPRSAGELDRLELLLEPNQGGGELSGTRCLPAQKVALPGPAPMLLDIQMAIGPDSRGSLVRRTVPALRQSRQVLPYAGLAPTLGKVTVDHEQEFESRQSSIADNTHSTRLAMAAPSAAIRAGLWFKDGLRATAAVIKTTIVALARKLLVALWK